MKSSERVSLRAGLSAVFVAIWSTGFIVGRAIVPLASPCLFLAVRFLLATLLFSILACGTRASWPRDWPRHVLLGMLVNGLYVVGGFEAVAHGLPPAVMALLGAMQPLLTAVLAMSLLGERPGVGFWLGALAGACGVSLVLWPALARAGALAPWVVGLGMLAVCALTIGTVLQKTALGKADLLPSMALQNLGGALFSLIAAAWLNETLWLPGPALYAALAWAALGLSGVGTGLLVWLVRQGQVARVTALMYLAPPLAAAQAYVLFGEQLQRMQLAAFAIALWGVWLCHGKGSAHHHAKPEAKA